MNSICKSVSFYSTIENQSKLFQHIFLAKCNGNVLGVVFVQVETLAMGAPIFRNVKVVDCSALQVKDTVQFHIDIYIIDLQHLLVCNSP